MATHPDMLIAATNRVSDGTREEVVAWCVTDRSSERLTRGRTEEIDFRAKIRSRFRARGHVHPHIASGSADQVRSRRRVQESRSGMRCNLMWMDRCQLAGEGRDLAEVQLYAMVTDASMLERAKFASTFPVTMNSELSSWILFYAPFYALATEIWETAPTHPGKLMPILRAIGCAQRDVHTHRLRF